VLGENPAGAQDESRAPRGRQIVLHATLLGVNRNGESLVNPPSDFCMQHDDDAVVVAQSLGTLAPLQVG